MYPRRKEQLDEYIKKISEAFERKLEVEKKAKEAAGKAGK